MYAVIVENDESIWDDKTGVLYHYPSRYAKLIPEGTQLIYYKGKLRDDRFAASRLSATPHYFGLAVAGRHYPDPSNSKDVFMLIEQYRRFKHAVPIAENGEYLETIPPTRTKNYWRDGVRGIDASTYERIVSKATLAPPADTPQATVPSLTNDVQQGLESGVEGALSYRLTTVYERDPRLRTQAIAIHGYRCAVCNFDFYEHYGDLGKGYIHIHHTKPIAEAGGPVMVFPETDLVPLCANCHAIIHRQRDRTLSIDELRAAYQATSKSKV